MPKRPFLPTEFTATKFSTAADKAEFGNHLLRFIESEWAQAHFTKDFYHRLSMCFGHIAHIDRPTFYETWFTCDLDRLRFLEKTLKWPCWAIRSTPFLMSSAPFSRRCASATTWPAINCVWPKRSGRARWRRSGVWKQVSCSRQSKGRCRRDNR